VIQGDREEIGAGYQRLMENRGLPVRGGGLTADVNGPHLVEV